MPPQTLNNTLGAAYLGTSVACILFGMTCLQAYWFFHSFPRDTRLHKVSVSILWALDTLHLGLIMHAVYHYAVLHFGEREALAEIVWSFKMQVAVNVVIVLLVQSMYTYRVWLLGGYHRGVLGYLVIAAVSGGFGVGIVFAYEVYTAETFAELRSVAWAIDISLAATTAIDLVIASAMIYYLRKTQKASDRFSSTISTLMQYVLGSGLLTSACSLTALITWIAMPDNLVFASVALLLTKLYVNSFFAMLNARDAPARGERLSLRLAGLPRAPAPQPPSPVWAPGGAIALQSPYGDEKPAYARQW